MIFTNPVQGCCLIGEIVVRSDFSLRHHLDEDLQSQELTLYDYPEAARKIARYDESGQYRSLKTAPNLRQGWLLQLKNLEEVLLALDFFYPAALSLWFSFLQGTLNPTPLRETLNRQSGMYRITRHLSDEQAQDLIGSFCCSDKGCLRKILWSINPEQAITSLPSDKLSVSTKSTSEIPLLCREACNLIVTAARPLVNIRPAGPNI
ncbi:MAG: hypothetical protein A3F67_04235 [Verrucomicrobia bacterium RIFCSPHIGHO2_12_FULL_41_10]|nr:MAG: hypothetical protein A3F67_04235 [Verrucomicrobia bacterium RIFCSPHIGHO2_12_FULL_41_10]